MPLMTVGVPTYNRRGPVVRLCRTIIPLVRRGEVALLVIDDGSSDSTWDALQEFAGDGVTLVRHEANAGYARTFAHLIDRCGTDYFMLVNDDDGVDADSLRRLGSWLPVERPDFVSTAHSGISGPTRPARATRPIDYVEFRAASAHGPGLVFRRSATIEPLAFLRDELDKGNAAAIVYPQVVVAAWLCTQGSAWWWSEAITWEADSLAPGLRDPSGLPYTAPAARLSQALGFNQMLWDLAQRSPTSQGRDRVLRLHALNARTLYPALRNAFVEASGPESGRTLDAASARQLVAVGLRSLRLRR